MANGRRVCGNPENARLRIALAAPTGKAAARLQEAVKSAKAALPCAQGIKDRLPVEAGAVLADVCNAGAQRAFSSGFSGQFAEVTGGELPPGAVSSGSSDLSDCIVELRKNYRFGEESGIYRLSQAVNDGDGERAIEALRAAGGSPGSQVSWRLSPEPARLKEALKAHGLRNFTSYLKCEEPAAALRCFGRFRILCAVRNGPLGVENIKRLAEETQAVQRRHRRFAPGRQAGGTARLLFRAGGEPPGFPAPAVAGARDRVCDDCPQKPGVGIRARVDDPSR